MIKCVIKLNIKTMTQITPFLKNGILGRNYGYLIPVTCEDPSVRCSLNEYEGEFKIKIWIGNTIIGIIDMTNYFQIHKDVSTLLVYSERAECLGTVWSLIEEKRFWDMLKIHNNLVVGNL